MNILVVGNGGREHALVWKLRQSTRIDKIFVAPGNAGTGAIALNIPLSDTYEIIDWVKKNPVDLVVIGPDKYLEEGMADMLQELKVPVFGATRAASEIEWSKAFAKRFMKEEGIPTAAYEIFSGIDEAREYVKMQKFPLVIKASGLALGKGVIIAKDLLEAEQALQDMMGNKIFGDAGNEVVIEEYLQGHEISVHAFCDGETASLFPASEDHKRIGEGDTGPNTGGMGTIAPLPWVTAEHMRDIDELVIKPTLAALRKHDRPFKGLLFPGIMITSAGPKVIEFNARFGDPETQSYMRLLETDLVDILIACTNGSLAQTEIKWSNQCACFVVCASGGYPGGYERGKEIHGLDSNFNHDVVIFHMGSKFETPDGKNGKIISTGGRVIGASATGESLQQALAKAYAAVNSISFDGMQFRKDIGKKSL